MFYRLVVPIGSRAIAWTLAMLLAAAAFGVRAAEEVLWWRVYGEESVDWYGSGITVGELAEMKGDILARVSVRDSSGETKDYLDLYMVVDPGTGAVVVPNGGSTIDSIYVPPANAFADLGEYGKAAYSFAIELGNWIDDLWTSYVVSEVRSYESLGDHITDWEPGKVPISKGEWIPSSYVVPEPSSGLLLAMGGALLALRRRRRL
jgi:hypothetical protein